MEANPFKNEADREHLIEGLKMAGLASTGYAIDDAPPVVAAKKPAASVNTFKKEDQLWHMTFDGAEAQTPEVKGFFDAACSRGLVMFYLRSGIDLLLYRE